MTMPDDFLLPRYGAGSLVDVLPSIGSHLGLGGTDVLRLPGAQRWVVALVDGLGAVQLDAHAHHAPYLSSLLRGGARTGLVTAGVPSTTVTSLTSLGTGLVPGRHGVVGYSCRNPRDGQFLNLLTWQGDVEPREFQPHPTMLARLADDGVEVTAVAPARFNGSGLTQVSLSGGRFASVEDESDEEARLAMAVSAAGRADRALVYFYERELDHTGHSAGVDSPEWRTQLRRIDAMLEGLREDLPDDVRLVVTGDHGMIDVGPEERIVLEDVPRLGADLDVFAGEGRFRQLYVAPGREDAVVQRWSDELGERALVLRREQAIEAGWFGEVADEVTQRYGDVLVAMRGTWAVMTRTLPGEMGLVGMHGSLTEAEMSIPLLVD